MISIKSNLFFSRYFNIFMLKKGFCADIITVCFYGYGTVSICSEDLTALFLISFYNFFAGEMKDILKTQTEYGYLGLYLVNEL